MQLKKILLPMAAFIGIVTLVAMFAIGIHSQNDRLITNRRLTATLHNMRISLASSSEALSNAVLSKNDANAEKFGTVALQRIDDFKSARQQFESEVKGAAELQLLHEIDVSFAKFEEVGNRLIQSSKQNSNRKAYALAVGPGLDQAKKIDGVFAQLLEDSSNGPKESLHLRVIEVYEARLALLRIQSILIRHIFEATDGGMDALESELQSGIGRIKSSLLSPHLTLADGKVQRIADIRGQLNEFERMIAEIITLSRKNTNIHAEEIAMSARLEATLDCDTKLNAFEQLLHKQLASLLPKGRGK